MIVGVICRSIAERARMGSIGRSTQRPSLLFVGIRRLLSIHTGDMIRVSAFWMIVTTLPGVMGIKDIPPLAWLTQMILSGFTKWKTRFCPSIAIESFFPVGLEGSMPC